MLVLAISPATIVLIVIAVILLVIVFSMLARQQSNKRLEDRFGPEYKRTVAATGDRAAAARELRDREKHRKRFERRDLDAALRNRYRERWRAIELRFIDEPAACVREADDLVTEVMTKRGYPMDEFDQRADDLSVDYPAVVENYRQAHRIANANERGTASTEELRKALVYYRSLFAELLNDADTRTQRLKETG